MKRNIIRALLLLRWITFIVLAVVSVVFLACCLATGDSRRLFPAIICVLGTSAILIKEIWLKKHFKP